MLTQIDFKAAALTLAIALGLVLQCGAAQSADRQELIVAGGCFWCVEADFESVAGVLDVQSGYTGGHTQNPTYKKIGKGGTGHYEAVRIRFDAERVSREQLLQMFFRSVDPTDAGGQFCDRGDSYRTAVFVSNPAEKALADQVKTAAQQELKQRVVTPVLPAKRFYKAEAYHQDYYKGDKIVLTRFGPVKQSKAYKKYRTSCGRDARVKQLWGKAAAFAH